MEVRTATFNELSTGEIYDILQLRVQVFVVEQDCVYQDIDGKDQSALHILGYEGSKLVAYARVFKPGDYFKRAAIGRVVVAPESRRKGLGKAIMEAAMNASKTHFKTENVAVSAQTYLLKFYKELGFQPIGEEYLEDGIPHLKMITK